MEPDYDRIAEQLSTSNDHKILRRLTRRSSYTDDNYGLSKLNGLFVDVETTGLDHGSDEVIEVALVPFEFALDGRIFRVGGPIVQLAEPAGSIPAEVMSLTGLTEQDVAGRSLDIEKIDVAVRWSHLIIAHNASFDRPFLEKVCPSFATRPWGCSMVGVDWPGFGYGTAKLEFLAWAHGFFYDAHRADADCLAGIELLSKEEGGCTVLSHVLASAMQQTIRVSVTKAPIHLNPIFKGRGYRWDGGAKTWSAEIEAALCNDEVDRMCAVGLTKDQLDLTSINAFNRYSRRMS